MSRLLSVAALVALAACGSPVAKMCSNLEAAFESCATGTTTATGTTGTGPTCEDAYADCDDADIDALNAMAECITADCADLTCYDGMADLSGACLGIDTTGTTTGT